MYVHDKKVAKEDERGSTSSEKRNLYIYFEVKYSQLRTFSSLRNISFEFQEKCTSLPLLLSSNELLMKSRTSWISLISICMYFLNIWQLDETGGTGHRRIYLRRIIDNPLAATWIHT
ncbi:unnamed protein product [Amoebophrya sp. A25]|nr:unnamed protein product [Amoebophrya sp. A25]|eukprot:GSA25T00007990001.1